MRINVGSGPHPLEDWVNIEQDPNLPAEVHVRVPPLPYDDASVEEVYAGHFLEHLTSDEATAFLAECHRVLVPGGRLGIVVPDTRAIMGAWLGGIPGRVEHPIGTFHDVRDLEHVCRLFLFSSIQDSPHRWAYDLATLARAMARAGFEVTEEINRFSDPRIPVGAWYQCGWDARKGTA